MDQKRRTSSVTIKPVQARALLAGRASLPDDGQRRAGQPGDCQVLVVDLPRQRGGAARWWADPAGMVIVLQPIRVTPGSFAGEQLPPVTSR